MKKATAEELRRYQPAVGFLGGVSAVGYLFHVSVVGPNGRILLKAIIATRLSPRI